MVEMINDMKRFVLFLSLSFILVSSCKKGIDKQPQIVNAVEFVVPEIPFVQDSLLETKSALNTNPISFAWELQDTVGIFPDKGSQVFFSMAEGAGSNTATFDGGGWSLKEASKYYSYYPLVGKFYLNPRSIPVSFDNQVQSNYEGAINSARFLLAATGISNESGSLIFNYSILNTILNVNCTLPAGVYTEMTLETENISFTLDGRYNLFADSPAIVATRKASSISLILEDISLNSKKVLPLYIMLAPVDLAGVQITVTVTESTGRKYVCTKVPSRAYSAGTRYGLTCSSFTEYAADYPDGVGSSEDDMGPDDVVITIK